MKINAQMKTSFMSLKLSKDKKKLSNCKFRPQTRGYHYNPVTGGTKSSWKTRKTTIIRYPTYAALRQLKKWVLTSEFFKNPRITKVALLNNIVRLQHRLIARNKGKWLKKDFSKALWVKKMPLDNARSMKTKSSSKSHRKKPNCLSSWQTQSNSLRGTRHFTTASRWTIPEM